MTPTYELTKYNRSGSEKTATCPSGSTKLANGNCQNDCAIAPPPPPSTTGSWVQVGTGGVPKCGYGTESASPTGSCTIGKTTFALKNICAGYCSGGGNSWACSGGSAYTANVRINFTCK